LNNLMPRPHLPYLQNETTRHGKRKFFVRLSRQTPRIRINGEYGSEQFMSEYQAALAGTPVVRKSLIAHKGSLRWLVDRWRESSDWHMTADSTKRQRDNILWHILEANGVLPFVQVDETAITAGRERRMKTPFAANNYLKTMRGLFGWAKEMKLMKENPASGVALLSRKTEGHEPWSIQDVMNYRTRWPLGTRQRVAFELLLWTGLRRGDAVKLGRQHVGQDGIARMKTEKTGKALAVPMAEPLIEALNAGPTGDLHFIVADNGKPYSKEGFGNVFRQWCDAAGVDKSAHGLRKLAAIEVAEGGGSELELQSFFGWSTGSQSSIYTRNAQREMMAVEALAKRVGNNSIPTPLLQIPAPKKYKGKSNG
jgi:integrase